MLSQTIYQQILLTLTVAVQKQLRESSSYDLRNLLGGTETVLNGIAERARTGREADASPSHFNSHLPLLAYPCNHYASAWPHSHDIAHPFVYV